MLRPVSHFTFPGSQRRERQREVPRVAVGMEAQLGSTAPASLISPESLGPLGPPAPQALSASPPVRWSHQMTDLVEQARREGWEQGRREAQQEAAADILSLRNQLADAADQLRLFKLNASQVPPQVPPQENADCSLEKIELGTASSIAGPGAHLEPRLGQAAQTGSEAACCEFRLDLTAPGDATCVCGKKKTEHGVLAISSPRGVSPRPSRTCSGGAVVSPLDNLCLGSGTLPGRTGSAGNGQRSADDLQTGQPTEERAATAGQEKEDCGAIRTAAASQEDEEDISPTASDVAASTYTRNTSPIHSVVSDLTGVYSSFAFTWHSQL